MNRWRRHRGLPGIVNFQALCREVHKAGPGVFGELASICAEGVLRRYCDAWFATAKRRNRGEDAARFPRRKRRLMPVRFRRKAFTLAGRRLRLATAQGCDPLWVRLDRPVPYPAEQVRSVTLVSDGDRLFVEVTAEVAVATYPPGRKPDRGRVAGVIHPFAVAGPDGEGLVVSGRAIRAESHLHLKDVKQRRRAMARRAPKPGQVGSRRWRKYRARQRKRENRHKRRVRQAQHEAAKTVVEWAVARRVGTLKVGDPRGVLSLTAGRRHNGRVRDWRIGYLLGCLKDKAEQAGIRFELVDERGTSSTCPACRRRVPKPGNRTFTCIRCGFSGHRDLVGGANIARRTSAGGTITTDTMFPVVIMHRRAGRHLPGAGRSRRDPRRRPHHGAAKGSTGRPWPAPPDVGTSLAQHARISRLHLTHEANVD
ncbi:transposase [Actinoallomurus sp. NBC_01490]